MTMHTPVLLVLVLLVLVGPSLTRIAHVSAKKEIRNETSP